MPDVNALFGLEGGNGKTDGKVVEIAIDQLHSFHSHPFRVLDDEKMQETVESVREHGIISPLLVRPGKESGYEIISGHRRKRACELLGLKTVPCFIRKMTDEEATVAMVDSNIQREELLYSEKAYAYKMKLDAIDRVKGRPKKEGQVVPDYLGKKSTEVAAEGSGESYKQVERYIRLTFLIKSLLDYVDEKHIAFGAGVELSYLEPEVQEVLYWTMQRLCVFPNLAQARKLKELSRVRKLDGNGMEIILSDEKPAAPAVKLQRKKLNEYFPAGYSVEQMEEVIYDLLKKWRFEQGDIQAE
jgi:ParB family chromosome partitioning protein